MVSACELCGHGSGVGILVLVHPECAGHIHKTVTGPPILMHHEDVAMIRNELDERTRERDEALDCVRMWHKKWHRLNIDVLGHCGCSMGAFLARFDKEGE